LILDVGFPFIWWNGDAEGNEKYNYAIESCFFFLPLFL
jgi:hypothetical protein